MPRLRVVKCVSWGRGKRERKRVTDARQSKRKGRKRKRRKREERREKRPRKLAG